MKKLLRPVILMISLATLFAGAMQVVAPAFVLNFVGAEINVASKQLFATIGMFMFLFGSMMVHALYNTENNRVVIIWSGFQKLGASVAVASGIFAGIFEPIAGGVAIFDLFSGILFFYYLKTLKSDAAG